MRPEGEHKEEGQEPTEAVRVAEKVPPEKDRAGERKPDANGATSGEAEKSEAARRETDKHDHKKRKPHVRRSRARRAPRGRLAPTPIYVPRWSRILLGILAFVALAYLAYQAPIIPAVAVGGTAIAIVLSYPVRALSRLIPRKLAILVTFLGVIGTLVLGVSTLYDPVEEQFNALIDNAPVIVETVEGGVSDAIDRLEGNELLEGLVNEEDVENQVTQFSNDLFDGLRSLVQTIPGNVWGILSGFFNVGIAIFGMLFVAVYLLLDVRKVKAAYLRIAPHRYRPDARELWDAFGVTLSRYLGGLLLVVAIQGVLAGVAMELLGVPYALLVGVWVALTAIIPYIGAFLGAVPAILLALLPPDGGPGLLLLVIVVYVGIQQLEGNFLTPRIQGSALKVHPIFVLFAVLAGAQLAGLLGAIFAVPALAVFRVLYDFLRARIQTRSETPEQL